MEKKCSICGKDLSKWNLCPKEHDIICDDCVNGKIANIHNAESSGASAYQIKHYLKRKPIATP